MSRPAQWALSPLDLQAHLLLPEGCHPKGVLKARCRHLLPLMATRFAEYSGRKCPECHLTYLTEAILSLRMDDTGVAVSDLVNRDAS
ncbi:MAG: hypothetical protein ACRDTH_21205 [Pseudonocardiaceae bacterium]